MPSLLESNATHEKWQDVWVRKSWHTGAKWSHSSKYGFSILYRWAWFQTHATHYQVVNYSHLFPTRYALELEGLKGAVTSDSFKEPSQRENAKKTIKKLFEDRYTSGKNKWFFEPLRVSSRFFSMLFTKYGLMLTVLILRCVSLRPKKHFVCSNDYAHFTWDASIDPWNRVWNTSYFYPPLPQNYTWLSCLVSS